VRELRTALLEYEGVPAERGLEGFLTGASLAQDTDDLGSHDTVLLMTLHTAKGLEFPYVFIAGLEEGLCPHSRSLGDEEQMAEEWRLFFVGATRAMRGLYLTYAARRQRYRDVVENEPSRFLLELRALVPELLAEDGPIAPRAASPSPPRTSGHPVAAGPSPRRPSAPPASAALPRFAVGDRVYHAHFGRGEVVSCERRGDDIEVQVEFEHVGRKRLSLAYAKLERL
jgi:DNA helicase-2/ATP-dependent DNA helicase PcrA